MRSGASVSLLCGLEGDAEFLCESFKLGLVCRPGKDAPPIIPPTKASGQPFAGESPHAIDFAYEGEATLKPATNARLHPDTATCLHCPGERTVPVRDDREELGTAAIHLKAPLGWGQQLVVTVVEVGRSSGNRVEGSERSWKRNAEPPLRRGEARSRYAVAAAQLPTEAGKRPPIHLVVILRHSSPRGGSAFVVNRLDPARKAALMHGGVHILRHTFCSHLAMRGAPARAIQELAWHADLTMTQRYMHLSPAALDSAIRLLEQPAGPVRSGRGVAETTDGPKDFGNMVATGRRE